jgi:hypothetical protein
MGELIDDLLAFSKLGQSTMQKSEVNLNELILDTLSDFQAETSERDIEWNIHPLPAVLADRAFCLSVAISRFHNAQSPVYRCSFKDCITLLHSSNASAIDSNSELFALTFWCHFWFQLRPGGGANLS